MWQFFISVLLNVFFPVTCLGCQKIGEQFCTACQLMIKPNPHWQNELGIHFWSIYDYNKTVHRKLIRDWKYKGNKKALQELVSRVVIPESLYSVDLIIPVPLHRQKQCERGFNQALLLAKEVAQKVKKPISTDLLRKKKTKSQAQLSREQRLYNVKGSFVWKGETLSNKNILLIDDVISTGSTIKACEEALKNVGAESIIAFSLARGGK